ncbi:MAG: YdeI/OmpD-associated family protein [Solirubrobacteraceae bacterium]
MTEAGTPFASAAAFEAWLAEQHAQSDGLWIRFAKKASGIPTVVYAEAVEASLRYGWIDGQVKGVDENYYVQRFTPRRARSRWSKINCGRAEALIARGAMEPAGLAEVERAKADGRWEAAYDAPSTATVPEDLRAALDADPRASAFFGTLDANNRYAILHRTQEAKKPETRARRIEKFVAMLSRGETIHPPRRAAR